jgi:DNA-binding transcriptional MerR regulator
MDASITIGELSAQSGVPTSTIRYYEREGLLRAEGRNASNYRVYTSNSLDRLHFIKTGQQSGLSLADLRILLEFRDGDRSACGEVREIVEARLAEVERQLQQLASMRSTLQEFRIACEEAEGSGECPVLRDLDDDG